MLMGRKAQAEKVVPKGLPVVETKWKGSDDLRPFLVPIRSRAVITRSANSGEPPFYRRTG